MHTKDEPRRKLDEDTEGRAPVDSSLSAQMQKPSRTGDTKEKKGPRTRAQVSLSTPAWSNLYPPHHTSSEQGYPCGPLKSLKGWCRDELMGTGMVLVPSQSMWE